MTSLPQVWGDALRRIQDEIPDFAFDAWIAPLEVKIAKDRLVLGCPNTFHRDRIRRHHFETLERCWRAALPDEAAPRAIELLTRAEFAQLDGQVVRAVAQASSRAGMRKVEAGARWRRVIGLNDAPVARSNTPRDSSSERLDADRPGTAPQDGDPNPVPSFRRIDPSARTPGAATASGPQPCHPSGPARTRARRVRALTVEPGSARQTRTGADRSGESDEPPKPREGLALDLDGEASPSQAPYRFESFIVGPCNSLAREACLALARRRQQSLNQLYLSGSSGLGKTHLARATAAEARRLGTTRRASPASDARPSQRAGAPAPIVLFTTAERFTSEFVSAMRNGRSEAWARRYRAPIELLVVEDIHFFAGRTKTQLELFHTIQHVLDAGGRVLLTGDRAPHELGGLDDRLRAQVGRGFVAELDRPDALVRRHLLRAKAAAGGVHLPPDCLERLVESTSDIDGSGRGASVRDVESILIQVVTTASLLGRPIDLALTQEAIEIKSGGRPSGPPRHLEVGEIVRIVAAFFGLRPEALASRSRRREVLVPRQLAMYLAHRYSEASLGEIGRALGREHPSVRNAIEQIGRQVLENAPVRYQVESLSERLDRIRDGEDGSG